LIDNLVFANKSNFDSIITDKFDTTEGRNISFKYPTKPAQLRKRKIPDADRPDIDAFKTQLISDLHACYDQQFGVGLPLSASEVFGDEEAEAIVSYLHQINTADDLRVIIGGECYDGQLAWLFEQVTSYKSALAAKGRSAPQKKAKPVPPTPASGSNPNPHVSSLTGQKRSPLGAIRPPTKKTLAAEASRRRSLEKKAQEELWLLSEQKRKDQIAQFLREGLEQARLEQEAKEHPVAGGNDVIEDV
jgi:hypothetical protein